MAVLLETSLGEMVLDLFTEKCPITTRSFLKLCKIKYYNHCVFHNVQKDFIVQTGDPTGTGKGGDSIYKFLEGEGARFFQDEIQPKDRHDKVGLVAMASAGKDLNASQFYITTRAGIDSLDGKHTIFGEVGEGVETLMRINEAFVDEEGRPFKNIRIKHTHVLDDPFDDPPGLEALIPEKSPEMKPPVEGEEVRLEDDWVPMDEGRDVAELEQELKKKEAQSRAVVLEMIGDLPEAEVKPPENVLFVCRLNPVTQDEDLEIIFSRFGKVKAADVIRDVKTGESLCYAFIEFDTQEACEAAYFKMDNVLIDDRRIRVDFSQSVSRLWNRFRKVGTKDSAAPGGNDFGPRGKGPGCFQCGEVGHFARECPNEGGEGRSGEEQEEEEAPKPRFELKDRGGQVGGAGKRYDFVFEEEPEERPAGKQRQRGATKEDEGRGNFQRERPSGRFPDGRQREHGGGREDREFEKRRGGDKGQLEGSEREEGGGGRREERGRGGRREEERGERHHSREGGRRDDDGRSRRSDERNRHERHGRNEREGRAGRKGGDCDNAFERGDERMPRGREGERNGGRQTEREDEGRRAHKRDRGEEESSRRPARTDAREGEEGGRSGPHSKRDRRHEGPREHRREDRRRGED